MKNTTLEFAWPTTIDTIIKTEWQMFVEVNASTGILVACQLDPQTFEIMRAAQFAAWSEAAAQSYLRDLEAARSMGRNLVKEKYVFMMLIDNPSQRDRLRPYLTMPSEMTEKLALIILTQMLEQTAVLHKRFPGFASKGRPLNNDYASPGNVSIRTYQLGELLTFSQETLETLLGHIQTLTDTGYSFVEQILEEEVQRMGFNSLVEAEAAIHAQ